MKDLIERLEAATGPDRALDAEIAAATGVIDRSIDPSRISNLRVSPDDLDWVNYEYEGDFYTDCAKPFTASIDAALTLVPMETDWRIERHTYGDESALYRAAVHKPGTGRSSRNPVQLWAAKNPAVALCIAALRARCSVPSPSRGGGE